MHPTISYYLAHVRIADLRYQAQRASLARAARRSGRRRHPDLRSEVLRRTPAVPGTTRAVEPAVAGDAPAA